MIVIVTANGYRFVNDGEIKSINHDKANTLAVITYHDGSSETAHQVESVIYTNKKDADIVDDGLLLGAMTSDKKYWKAMRDSAEYYGKELFERVKVLESFIISVAEHPDSYQEYRNNFIENMKEEMSKRAGCFENELEKRRDFACFNELRNKAYKEGKAAEQEFARMTRKIADLQDESNYYLKALVNSKSRNLWERIINKEVL